MALRIKRFRFKYHTFRLYLYGFLPSSIQISSLTNDEVTAACIALHVARREKNQKTAQKD
ncbi:MAG: hypothetical protein CV087_23675 [Candidatus Brocadia sp. WS118]|nr:MAG: hypothetical protein CV087_23675 [Candidatus Brocadia sp. WS118]